MRRTRKILCYLLSIAFFLALSPSAYLAGGEDASGVITLKDTIIGKSYVTCKIFDMTTQKITSTDSSSSIESYAYTVSEGWDNFFDNGSGKQYLVNSPPDGETLNIITFKNTIKYMNITENNIANFSHDALAYMTSVGNNTTNFTKSHEAESTTLEIKNLTLGYYLVYPAGATETKDTFSSICSLTNTNPTQNVQIKSKYPTVETTADKEFCQIGSSDPITYTVTGKVPDLTGYSGFRWDESGTSLQALYYDVEILLDDGLTFVDNSVLDFEIPGYDDENKPPLSDYISHKLEDNTDGKKKLTVSISMLALQDYIGKKFKFTYKAKANDKASEQKFLTNTVALTYSNNPLNPSLTDTIICDSTPNVRTFNINIDKYCNDDDNDESTNIKLEGAKFKLYKQQQSDTSSGTSLLYYTKEENKVSWEENSTSNTVLTTDSNGKATFTGLSDGEYYLEEVVAPNGFNKLAKSIKIKIDKNSESKNIEAIIDDTTAQPLENETNSKPNNFTVHVMNRKGALLPETGGTGTILFTIVGSMLIIAVSYLLLIYKRKKQKLNSQV